ncbi:DUF7662 domain-containing protein [Longimicrobium terrae]|uniref:DUF7662 domain-containing protein n=1 Tax=Longimicrobium terrae TaxID=1639882 RepID=A0A841H4C2_9BACT|nr:hypothetical protein [Longimicrobium terrae]MBB4638512.1 hypothetical protein [Longimicrobium terrae]MBB6072850.1 hypothetical protein [Longimicrobium terrae]NNC30533.1 hypothetical protein [Longimicrobium terrae]
MKNKGEESMNLVDRAWQIWPLLVHAARNRQTLTYEMIAQLTGMATPGVGGVLEPIQSYCLLNKLPALTALVVSKKSGLPGTGFIAAQDVPREFVRIFRHNWTALPCPGPAALAEAVQRLPSNGISLDEQAPSAKPSPSSPKRVRDQALAGKFESLRIHLQAQQAGRVRMTFSEIVDMIGVPLPQSAFTHRAWWSNPSDTSNRRHAAAWMATGFRVTDLNQDRESGWVVFERP